MKIYFIGIGGISMSALAQFLHDRGEQVLGSDLKEGEMIDTLRQKGIKVFVPQKKENIDSSIDEVVYTSAITPGSPGDAELKQARKLGIKTIKRAEKIGELTKKFKTIGVAGTHGKSTTTAMMLQILMQAGKDPSALLGSDFNLIGGNFRVGKGKYLVTEADEYDRSLLNFYVDFGIILNLETDHLDYFKGGIEEIKEVFYQFVSINIKKNGVLVFNNRDKNVVSILEKEKRADIKYIPFFEPIKIKLQVPGEHNRLNASAAYLLSREIGIEDKIVRCALSEFRGAARRFDFKGEKNGVKIFDDYAHHPTEIKATIAAAREKFEKERLIVVFQPHQYSRAFFFAKEFARSFAHADLVFIPPIYAVPGRDEEKKIDNFDLVKMIKANKKEAIATKSFTETVRQLKKITKPGDIVLVMGAGPVNQITDLYLA